MPFEVTIHPEKQILEIVYPAQPTAADIAAYGAELERIIGGLRGGWASLVDQRQLEAMPSELLRAIAVLNRWAEAHRMQRSARVVADRAAGMSSWRIAREGSVRVPIRSFDSREEALAWLEESAASAAGEV